MPVLPTRRREPACDSHTGHALLADAEALQESSASASASPDVSHRFLLIFFLQTAHISQQILLPRPYVHWILFGRLLFPLFFFSASFLVIIFGFSSSILFFLMSF